MAWLCAALYFSERLVNPQKDEKTSVSWWVFRAFRRVSEVELMTIDAKKADGNDSCDRSDMLASGHAGNDNDGIVILKSSRKGQATRW